MCKIEMDIYLPRKNQHPLKEDLEKRRGAGIVAFLIFTASLIHLYLERQISKDKRLIRKEE